MVTANGIAIALAVVVALGFLFFGSALFTPFQPQSVATQEMVLDENGMPVEAEVAGTVMGTERTHTTKPNANAMSTDVVVGTGAEAVAGKKVTVHYVGTLENGTVFDASTQRGQPFTFTLGVGQVIQGWDEGVAGMKVGGKRHLVIPAEKAYGDRAVGSIPAGSTLIFEVELLGVE